MDLRGADPDGGGGAPGGTAGTPAAGRGRGHRRFKALLFDLDDTLYPVSSGLAAACRQRILDYMVHRLGIPAADAPALCLRLYQEHGTTMAGLVAAGNRIDAAEFYEYVHGALPYAQALRPDPALRALLRSLPQRPLLVFTNADRAHAHRVLDALGVQDCFHGLISFESVQDGASDAAGADGASDPAEAATALKRVVCKPAAEAFRRALALAGLDPADALFLDDSARNVAGAKAAGLATVLVGSAVRCPGADYAVESLHNLREAVPEIWDDGEPDAGFDDLIHPALVCAAAVECAQVQA